MISRRASILSTSAFALVAVAPACSGSDDGAAEDDACATCSDAAVDVATHDAHDATGDAPVTDAPTTDAPKTDAKSDASSDAAKDGGTTVARPSYNTGTGFFVVGDKLYDPKGVEFRIRGVNKLHWDADSPGIPKTHANTERWVIDFAQPTATNLALMKKTIDAHIVPMPGNWDGTCKEDAATLSAIVDTWVAQASAWKTIDGQMILNVANEWGPSDSTAWRDAYVDAVHRLRDAGYLCTISVTAGGCGQDNADLVKYAADVLAADPQKNVIFDQHIYGNWKDGSGAAWQTDLVPAMDALAAKGLVFLVGEFGPGRDIGPSPTSMTPGQIVGAAEKHAFGWMAWAWDDPAFGADDGWFALSLTGDYASSADLTSFGKDVVEDPTRGLLVLAKPQTAF